MKFENLYDYQQKAVVDIRGEIQRKNKRILLRQECGAGKTVISSYLAAQIYQRKKRLYFVVHRRELLEQASKTFRKFGIPHGIIAPGFTPSNHNIQVASVFTLVNRLDKVPKPDMVIFDECQYAVSNTWIKCIEHFGDIISIGLSATPIRLDGKGFEDIFDVMVNGPSMKELIKKGKLCNFNYYAPPTKIDFSELTMSGNDFNPESVEKAIDKPTITGDLIQHYKELIPGKRAIGFSPTVKHCYTLSEEFRRAGINAAAIDGNDEKNRIQAVQDFRDNKLQVLFNVNIVSEGMDIQGMDAVIDTNPTQSLARFVQRGSRCLRSDPENPDKVATILDHSSNIYTHGAIDADREWSLKGGKKNKPKQTDEEKSIAIRQCSECYAIHPTAPECPACGFVYQIKARDYKQVDGKLVQIDYDKIEREQAEKKEKQDRKYEVSAAKSLEELMLLEVDG